MTKWIKMTTRWVLIMEQYDKLILIFSFIKIEELHPFGKSKIENGRSIDLENHFTWKISPCKPSSICKVWWKAERDIKWKYVSTFLTLCNSSRKPLVNSILINNKDIGFWRCKQGENDLLFFFIYQLMYNENATKLSMH